MSKEEVNLKEKVTDKAKYKAKKHEEEKDDEEDEEEDGDDEDKQNLDDFSGSSEYEDEAGDDADDDDIDDNEKERASNKRSRSGQRVVAKRPISKKVKAKSTSTGTNGLKKSFSKHLDGISLFIYLFIYF
jgi:DNA repair and recombination RAD54-like protein